MKVRQVEHCGMYEQEANAYRVMAGKPEEKSLIRGPKYVWVNNTKKDH